MRGTCLAFQPKRTLVPNARIEEQAALPDRRATSFDAEAHAFGTILEFDVCQFDLPAFGRRLPVRLEVFALKPGAANLLGKEPIFHGMVDVFQKLPVDPVIDLCRNPVCIDEQDGDARLTAEFSGS